MWVDPSLIFDHRVSVRHIFTLYSSEDERALSMSESGMTDSLLESPGWNERRANISLIERRDLCNGNAKRALKMEVRVDRSDKFASKGTPLSFPNDKDRRPRTLCHHGWRDLILDESLECEVVPLTRLARDGDDRHLSRLTLAISNQDLIGE